MRRPKIADMNALELARFRCLQCRRFTRRQLEELNAINPNELCTESRSILRKMIIQAETALAMLPRPAWIKCASLAELSALMDALPFTPDQRLQ